MQWLVNLTWEERRRSPSVRIRCEAQACSEYVGLFLALRAAMNLSQLWQRQAAAGDTFGRGCYTTVGAFA